MWFELLQSAREIGVKAEVRVTENGETKIVIERHFGAEDFASVTSLSPKDASAWISKFVRWGYAKRVGSTENPGLKPRAVYALTDFGLNVTPKNPNRLKRLLTAIQELRDAVGEKAQSDALKELFKVYDKVKETKRSPRRKK